MAFTAEGLIRGNKYRVVFLISSLALFREATMVFLEATKSFVIFDLRPEHGTTPIRLGDIKEVYEVADDAVLVPPHIYRGKQGPTKAEET